VGASATVQPAAPVAFYALREGEHSMEVGDNVTVRTSGRRARIVGDLGNGRFQVEFLPEIMDDPVDRDTVQSEDESGIYDAGDLEPLN